MWEVYCERTIGHRQQVTFEGFMGEVNVQTPTAAACEVRQHLSAQRPVLWVVRPDGSNAHQIEFDGLNLTVLEVVP